jgi:PAS domain S-box-containing protein
MMSTDPSDHRFSTDQSLAKLMKELSEVRSQLAAKEKKCLELSQELNLLKSKNTRTSEQPYRSLFEAMSEGFALHEIICDADGKPSDYRFLEVNPAFERLTGLKHQDLIGRRVKEVLPGTETHWIDRFGRVALTGEPLHMEEFSRDLGRWYDVIAYRTEPRHFAVVFTDTTERKRFEEALHSSEARYRQLFETASEGIWQIDAEFRTIDLNARMAQMLGCRREEIIGRHVREFMAPEELADVDQRMENRRRGLSETYERRLLKKDGSTLWTLVSVTPLHDIEGNLAGSFGMFTDISDRKLAEENLRRLNENLEQQVTQRTRLAEARASQLQALAVQLIEAEERERRRVAQLLHDDLQQILAAARMQLETACESLPPEPMLANVGLLLEESMDKSRRLSHDLSPAVLHHSGLIAALKWLGEQLQDKFGLQVRLESDSTQLFEDSPLKAFLFRAVQELLFNVIKHAGVKSAHVVLSDSDNSLAIAVSDPGLGFNPELLDSHDKTTGFGLMSIRERARYVGGDLVIESRPKQGSCLRLTVPARLTGADDLKWRTTDREPLASTREPDAAGEGGIRVLIVDDHPLMREGLTNLMKAQADIQVIGEAANGREAIERVRQLKPDLVFMDVSMPEMDGIEATRRIKAEQPMVRIVGLSVHEDEHFASAMREAGAEAFMSKTASFSQMLKAIYGR